MIIKLLIHNNMIKSRDQSGTKKTPNPGSGDEPLPDQPREAHKTEDQFPNLNFVANGGLTLFSLHFAMSIPTKKPARSNDQAGFIRAGLRNDKARQACSATGLSILQGAKKPRILLQFFGSYRASKTISMGAAAPLSVLHPPSRVC